MESVFISRTTAKGEEWKLRLCWRLYWASAIACLTCLIDRYFWQEVLIRGWNLLCGVSVCLVKILATVTFPISGLVLAFLMARENRKTLARLKPGQRKSHGQTAKKL